MKCAWTYSVCRMMQSKNKEKNKSEEGGGGDGESVGFYGFENVPSFLSHPQWLQLNDIPRARERARTEEKKLCHEDGEGRGLL